MLAQALRETIRVQGGRVPLLERHLERLRAGGCDAGTLDAARAAVEQAAAGWPHACGRLTLRVARAGAVEIEVSDRSSAIAVEGGPVVALVSSAVPDLPPGGAKPDDRSQWDVAFERARELGADLAVLVDADGFIIDCSHATVWLVAGGVVCTPPAPPALSGVSRAVVLDDADRLGLPVEVRRVHAREWDGAEEVFLTTAVGGAVAVRDRGGPVSDRAAALFASVFGV